MRPFFFIASLLALALAVTATTATSGACERGYDLVPKNGKCVCKSPWYGTKPPKPGCTTVIKRYGYEEYCQATCPPPPHPSYKPKPKRNMPILMPDGTLSRCPLPMVTCPLDAPPSLNGKRATATISMSDPYECIKPAEDLYNCGGCSSTGQGTNCNAIAGVRGTSCTEGKCMIYTCQKGYKLIINGQGAQECIRKTPRRM